jgi:hypothetical protein
LAWPGANVARLVVGAIVLGLIAHMVGHGLSGAGAG